MRRSAALGVFLASVLAARGDAPELVPAQIATLRASVQRLRQTLGTGALTAERAWAFEIGGFTEEEYKLAADALPDAELPDDVREAFRHACRTAVFRCGPFGRLEKARDICYLLGSPSGEDWLKAFRLLRREPFTEDLDRAVIALGRDGRPEVRLIAARLATSLVIFGRKAEGLMDTVLACLMDPNPNVVAACSLLDAPQTRDKRVIDRVVACLSDDRALDRRASPILNMGTANKVDEFVQHNLSWMFWQERCARCKWEPPSFDAAGNRLPSHEPVRVLVSPDEILAWWKENREAFGFATPARQWRCVFDDVVVLDVGNRTVVFDADGMPLKIQLKVYREHWLGGEPVTTIEGDIHTDVFSEEEYVSGFGNPDHYDGHVSRERGTWGNGMVFGEIDCRAAFLPTHKTGRVRMKLTMHIGHLGR